MCFYADYDWYASVCETEDRIADKPFKCHECCAVVAAGESYRYVFQQEQETCQRCEEGECECSDADDPAHDCQCYEPNYGETFEYCICQNCRKFLDAVERHELNEGCRKDEARPPLGEMVEYMREIDALDGYFAEAEKMFPELAENGYLDRMRGVLRYDD